jgi:hypothetical protein
VACSPQQVDEKGLFFLLLLLGKRDEKELKKTPPTTNMSVNSSHNKWMKKEVSRFFTYFGAWKLDEKGENKNPSTNMQVDYNSKPPQQMDEK